MLYSRFEINYNDLPPMFRKGSLVLWEDLEPAPPPALPSIIPTTTEIEGEKGRVLGKKKIKVPKVKRKVIIVHEDLISDEWWETGRGKGILEG